LHPTERTSFHPAHPLPALRLASVLGRSVLGLTRMRTGREPQRALGNWAAGVLEDLKVETELEGPIPPGGQLWVCNHLSWLDPLVCLRLRPSPCLVKAEVADYPLLGRAVRQAGMRFVDRGQALGRASALLRLASDLHRGENLLLFPEGTTTRGERLAPLHEGGLRAAYRLGIPVLPLRLSSPEQHYAWTGDESLLPHLLTLARAPRTRVRIAPGTLLLPASFPRESQWLRAIEAHLSPRIHELRGTA